MTISTTILPDIQKSEPFIKIPIDEVGVENVAVPFGLASKYGGINNMVANVSMRTNLDENTKGISMSRLLRTLKKYLDLPLKQQLINQILMDIAKEVGATKSYMKFEFLLPIKRKSLITSDEFPIFHKCRFEGQLEHIFLLDAGPLYDFKFYQGVVVQYASYCPCSAELSKDLINKGSFGFPHAQRSYANIIIECDKSQYIWLEDIVEAVERAIKTIPYPIIKREDEQRIAEIAAQNPMFVEDAIRAISNEINSMKGVLDWHIKCRHEESIHTSEAVAINYKGVKGGFDYKCNL